MARALRRGGKHAKACMLYVHNEVRKDILSTPLDIAIERPVYNGL